MPPSESRDARSTLADRYRVLLEIGRTLAGTLSFDDLCEAIYRETAEVMVAEGFFISRYDAEEDRATVVFYADRGEVHPGDGATYRGKDSEVIGEGRPVLVEDGLGDDPLMVLGGDRMGVTRSGVSAPMMNKGRIVGAISAQSYQAHAYSQEDLTLLQGIADIAAVAVDNALQVAELEARRREAERVEEIGRALAASLDPKDVLGKVVEAVVDILQVDGASVWLKESGPGCSGRIAASAGPNALPHGLTWDLRGPLAEALIERQEAVVLDDLEGSPLIPPHVREHLQAGSGMGVPLLVGGQVSGVLTAGTRPGRRFGAAAVGVLQRLANQASVALENARLHANLQALSLTDPLTGLPNRRRLQIHLEKEVAAARRGRSLVVVLFDLDNFKHYNDTLGHLVGDDILRAFGQILDEENRAMNLVARYGGDEFVSILSESHLDGARLYVNRVTQRVADDPVLSEHGITVSCGLAEFDRASMRTVEDVIQAADADMYREKEQKEHHRRAASP